VNDYVFQVLHGLSYAWICITFERAVKLQRTRH